jgi:hypothetical protein
VSRGQVIAARERWRRAKALVDEAAATSDRKRKLALIREAIKLTALAKGLMEDLRNRRARPGGLVTANSAGQSAVPKNTDSAQPGLGSILGVARAAPAGSSSPPAASRRRG